jgi:hypothetical protein
MMTMRRSGAMVVATTLLACGGGEPAPRGPEASPASTSARNAPPADVPAVTPAAPAGPSAVSDAWPFGPAPSADERTALLDRLKKDAGPLKSNWSPPGKSERYGHAEGLIAAPPDAVRARLVDFARYKDLAGPKFKSVKIVDKQGANTDVYFQLPIMKGLITIWYVTRFPPARSAGGGDVVEGTFVKGNIKGMHIAFKVMPGPDEKNSVMVCDLLLSPTVPAPQSAVDEELRDACGDAISAVRKTATAP